jgi:hypothetical protein
MEYISDGGPLSTVRIESAHVFFCRKVLTDLVRRELLSPE